MWRLLIARQFLMTSFNVLFDYPELSRVTNADGTRFYTCPKTHNPLPSVTTILSATADKTGLLLWEEAVGKKKADRVREEAAVLGTLMHTHVENHIKGVERPRGNMPIRMLASRMADQIIQKGISAVNEVWGLEVAMYYPGLYAGTTDLVGIHDNAEAIMDHKTTKKMKSEDMIQDYFAQMGAYCLAHDEVYGTRLKKGVVFMVDRELNYKQFVIEGAQFERHKENFLRRLETYLNQQASAAA